MNARISTQQQHRTTTGTPSGGPVRARTLPVRCSEPGSPHPRSCRLSAAQAGSLAYQRPRSRADVASALPYVLFLSYPLFWFLGIPWLWGITLTLPMTVVLISDIKHVRVPRGFWIWVLFLAWQLLSGVQLVAYGPDRVMAFMFRFFEYYTGTILLLWFFNSDEERITLEPAGEGRCVPVGHDDHPGHARAVVPGIHPAHAREQGAAQRSDEHPAGVRLRPAEVLAGAEHHRREDREAGSPVLVHERLGRQRRHLHAVRDDGLLLHPPGHGEAGPSRSHGVRPDPVHLLGEPRCLAGARVRRDLRGDPRVDPQGRGPQGAQGRDRSDHVRADHLPEPATRDHRCAPRPSPQQRRTPGAEPGGGETGDAVAADRLRRSPAVRGRGHRAQHRNPWTDLARRLLPRVPGAGSVPGLLRIRGLAFPSMPNPV